MGGVLGEWGGLGGEVGGPGVKRSVLKLYWGFWVYSDFVCVRLVLLGYGTGFWQFLGVGTRELGSGFLMRLGFWVEGGDRVSEICGDCLLVGF